MSPVRGLLRSLRDLRLLRGGLGCAPQRRDARLQQLLADLGLASLWDNMAHASARMPFGHVHATRAARRPFSCMHATMMPQCFAGCLRAARRELVCTEVEQGGRITWGAHGHAEFQFTGLFWGLAVSGKAVEDPYQTL